jgi:hypothetical protein
MTIPTMRRALQHIARNTQRDGFLTVIAAEPDLALGLLVNGMTIYGRTATERAMAEALDSYRGGSGRHVAEGRRQANHAIR